MNKRLIQLHELDPEEFKKEILDGVKTQITELAERINSDSSDEWISRKQAAEMLDVSLVTIASWCNKGILHPYKIGNRVRFRKKDIEKTLLGPNH